MAPVLLFLGEDRASNSMILALHMHGLSLPLLTDPSLGFSPVPTYHSRMSTASIRPQQKQGAIPSNPLEWAVSACMLEDLDHLLQYDFLLIVRILLWLAVLVLLWEIVNAPDFTWAINHRLPTVHAQKESAITSERSVSLRTLQGRILLTEVLHPPSAHRPIERAYRSLARLDILSTRPSCDTR